jgi:hypothetical protein
MSALAGRRAFEMIEMLKSFQLRRPHARRVDVKLQRKSA